MSRIRTHRRGQAFIEFALIVPLLVLLLVMAIDVGRVFFGWIAINNAARIAADAASERPEAWPADNPLDTQAQNQYRGAVVNDLQAINCDPPGGGDWEVGDIPPPSFPDGKAAGDRSIVALECDFSLLTPLANVLLGGGIDLGAEATFPIHEVLTLALPTPRPTPTPTPSPVPSPTPTSTATTCTTPIAAFVGTPTSGRTPLNVTFTDQSSAGAACPITAWLWNFGDGTTSNLPNPTHLFVHVGNGQQTRFDVTLTVTSTAGTDVESKNNYITVTR